MRQNQVTYNHGPAVNICNVYETTPDTKASNIALEKCLFGAVKLIKNAMVLVLDWYQDMVLDLIQEEVFHIQAEEMAIIFGADLSSSVHANNKVNNILILGKDFIQGINATTIYAEKMYSTNFTVDNKRFCLRLYYNGDNSYLFVNGKEIHKFKAKYSELVPHALCLGYMISSGLIGYVYNFSVDYGAIAVDDLLDIHKCLMKKNDIV